MTTAQIALLPDRGVVSVAGPDAEKLLQGILTNDVARLESGAARHAALLSPQGKILFEFLAVRTSDGFLLDVAREKAAELTKRIAMYKLRAAVAIADESATLAVAAAWDGTPDLTGAAAIYADPRNPGLGVRLILPSAAVESALAPCSRTPAAAETYHARRIVLGVPEGGKDFAFGDAFPHEALMDQLGGVSFTKGCYVGQEVVSRMEHRGTARTRVVRIQGEEPPRSGQEVKAGDTGIGVVGSVAGKDALALLKLDRVVAALDAGIAIRAGDAAISVEPEALARFRSRQAEKA